jgi:hypothetical protein
MGQSNSDIWKTFPKRRKLVSQYHRKTKSCNRFPVPSTKTDNVKICSKIHQVWNKYRIAIVVRYWKIEVFAILVYWQRWFVVSYRRFGTTYRSLLKGSTVLDFFIFEDSIDMLAEISVTTNQMLHNTPEEPTLLLHRGRDLKSRAAAKFLLL